MKKRLLSWLLVLTMAVGLCPTVVIATESDSSGSITSNYTVDYDTVILAMEESYEDQDLFLAWENVGLKDVEFSTDNENTAARAAIEAITAESLDTSTVMKAIFTLAALGYDPTDITLLDESTVNAIGVLNDCADTASSWYFYTAPFVNLAFGVTDDQSVNTDTQVAAHVDLLVDGLKTVDYTYGVDTPAMTIMGLAPYYNSNSNVKDAVDDALTTIAGSIGANGTYGNSNTDAMVILAYTMLGMDPASVAVENGTDLVNGFLSYLCEDYSGFGYADTAWNQRATYQGLMALKAVAEFEETNSAVNLFDFTEETLVPLKEIDVQSSSSGGDTGGDAGGTGEEITVTVNISDKGEFVIGKDGIVMAGVEVTLDGTTDASHDIDGALKQAHVLYYDGVDGYATSDGGWGLSIDKLWGDTSYSFGYYVDGAMAWGLTDPVVDGSVVDAYIMTNYWEGYSYFNPIASATVGEAVVVTLKQDGYDLEWNPVVSLCADATIYIDGVSTGIVTDENGEATIVFENAGNHWLTAKKDANEDGLTDIVAPYAAVYVTTASDGDGSGSGAGGSSGSSIDVTFTVEADNNTWFAEDLELEEGDSVKDAFYAAFGEHEDYDYTIDGGSYVKSITHPSYGEYGEFTHGANSGWKYAVNGEAPEIAFNSYTLEDDDEVLFYYVMDYTTDSGGSSSSSTTVTTEDTQTDAEDDTAFTDVIATDWFASAVSYAVENGLFYGTSDTSFAPNDTMTRAMIWTVLARAAGEDTTLGDSWYAVGMDWAIEAGISDGSDPDGSVTREQLATMLYRYEQNRGGGFTGNWMFQMDYEDLAEVSDWAMEAIYWMVMKGVITGTSDTTLAPNEVATRAQVATMIMRYLEL